MASIRVLALSPVDLTAALAAASGRHATIRALDTGMEIAPDAGAAEIAAAAAAWDKARRDDQTREARGMGNEAAVRAAERRREAWLAIARPLWGLPSEEMPATEIAKRSGLSVGTLYRFLDRRTPTQRRAKAKTAQTDLRGFPRAAESDQTERESQCLTTRPSTGANEISIGLKSCAERLQRMMKRG